MSKPIFLLVLCLFLSMGLFAQSQTTPQLLDADSLTEDSLPVKTRYTFGDFFDALDLPTVLGVGFTPNSVESATFNSAMRLGWRHHKNYGTFVYITYDTHSNKYEQLKIDGSNVYSGEVWYNEVGMSVGYRVPLVKDIKAFYQKPYFHPWDFFVSIQPGISIATFKNMVPEFPNFSTSEPLYTMDNVDHIVPTLKISAGVEWFVFHNFAVFSEVAYTQHLMPTLLEKAAMKQYPSGPITLSVGLSLFFN